MEPDELDSLVIAIMHELSSSEEATHIRNALGTCPFRFVARFAPLNGAEWGRILGFAYSLASGPECSCYYCKKEKRHE